MFKSMEDHHLNIHINMNLIVNPSSANDSNNRVSQESEDSIIPEGQEYIHKDSCYVATKKLANGEIEDQFYDVNNLPTEEQFVEGLDVNVPAYCSLMISTLLNPADFESDDVEEIKTYMERLLFVANPQLNGSAYIEQVFEKRTIKACDRLCDLLIEGLDRKFDYIESQSEDPLF